MRKEKLLAVMFFFSLIAEDETVLAYYNEMWTPARLMTWFTYFLPIKVQIFELACVALLIANRRRSRGTVARPLVRAIYVSITVLLFSVLYGLVQGGQLKPINTQIHVWLFTLVFALTTMSVMSKPEDFRLMNSAIVWAALWRSCMALCFYLKVRDRPWDKLPSYMTTHEDTVLFVVGLLILVARCIEFRTKKAVRMLIMIAPLILLAIQVNNRRLAWASLVAGLIVIYSMLPSKSKVTRRLNKGLKMLAPVLILYVAIGWGRPEKMFKPLAAFSAMSGEKADNSTRARDNENLSLITMIRDRPILGTGLGREWVELDASFTVSADVFPMYHYSPHNTVLALVAFCGGLGFAGLWMVLPVSVYLNSRTYRKSMNPVERSVAIVGIVEVVAYLNQAWGDMAAMNNTHMLPAVILGAGLASAARLSVISGAWPSGSKSRVPRNIAKPQVV